ncbi:MAG: hypothetical protein U1E15_11685 [Hyphomicrobiales bacterium]
MSLPCGVLPGHGKVLAELIGLQSHEVTALFDRDSNAVSSSRAFLSSRVKIASGSG